MALNVSIFMDESGDLGWSLDKPYGSGGSSRHLTLAAVLVPTDKAHHLKRIVRGLYKNRKRAMNHELKSVELSVGEKTHFIEQMIALKIAHPDIHFFGITVCKKGVNTAFRQHPNGLYNYMTKLLLLDEMAKYPHVDFIPDARSVKIELKHAMHDYLKMELAAKDAHSQLMTTPQESKDHLEIQFADILSSIIWAHYEYQASPFTLCRQIITCKNLFFPKDISVL